MLSEGERCIVDGVGICGTLEADGMVAGTAEIERLVVCRWPFALLKVPVRWLRLRLHIYISVAVVHRHGFGNSDVEVTVEACCLYLSVSICLLMVALAHLQTLDGLTVGVCCKDRGSNRKWLARSSLASSGR